MLVCPTGPVPRSAALSAWEWCNQIAHVCNSPLPNGPDTLRFSTWGGDNATTPAIAGAHPIKARPAWGNGDSMRIQSDIHHDGVHASGFATVVRPPNGRCDPCWRDRLEAFEVESIFFNGKPKHTSHAVPLRDWILESILEDRLP